MSKAITFEVCTGDMPTNQSSHNRKKGSGRYEPVLDRLVANPESWVKVGPFVNKKVATTNCANLYSAAKRRGIRVRCSIMPDFHIHACMKA
ncbi:MAG: hypothetical protein JJ916_04020 [Phycisphaerales bacterium]|nr:hypothetical protein [Phycisphaerales bacterium]